MIIADRINVTLTDPALFQKKLLAVGSATLVLVPLVYFKLYVPAWIYLVSLLALHLVFLYTYLAKTPWRKLTAHKAGFALRMLSVVFFGYLLVALKFHGSVAFVLANLVAGLAIHTLILFSLMAEIRTVELPS